MSQSSRPLAFVRFAQFELDSRAGELRKDSRRIKLQEQPLQILAMLLEHPGQVVIRDELREKLWPSDTFVDFNHGLNSAVARLREALDDSAERPKYIETVARRGYRFIAPVDAPTLEAPTQTVVAHAAERRSLSPIVRRLVVIPAAVA